MPDSRTPSRWPYRAAKPLRRKRVVRTGERAGVQRPGTEMPPFRVTRLQARLALFSVFAALLVAGAWWMYRSPYLTVHEIEVIGAQRFTEQQIAEAADLDGQSTLTVDTAAAEARIAALSGIRSVSIEKQGWTGATITIEERVPWGAWQVGDTRVPIDIDGYVLDGFALDDEAPVIVAANPQGAITSETRLDAGAIEVADRLLRESERTLGLYVQSLIYREDAGLTAVLYGPALRDRRLWVTFGDAHDYEFKVATLYVLLEQARDERLVVTSVDLRFGTRPSFN